MNHAIRDFWLAPQFTYPPKPKERGVRLLSLTGSATQGQAALHLDFQLIVRIYHRFGLPNLLPSTSSRDHRLPLQDKFHRSLPYIPPSHSSPHSTDPPPDITTMFSSNSALWKSLLLPPLFAALLYLLLTYLILPLYHRHRARALHYMPMSSTSALSPTSVRTRLINMFSSRWSQESGEEEWFAASDEELEEGIAMPRVGHEGTIGQEEFRLERRLSRELEMGFRDESDEDEARGRRG